MAQAKSQLAVAKKNLADCRLVAPVSGIIGRKYVGAGETAMPSQAVVTILDISSVKVTGITSVTLKFGGVGEDAAMFATLSEAGAFKEFTSQKIFEESKGLLA